MITSWLQHNYFLTLVVFLVLNFGALALGSVLMGSNPMNNEWYQTLNKAPWTPPGWVFGVAWTTIMLCFSFFMTNTFTSYDGNNTWLILFAIQWLLNVSWNPLFFRSHLIVPSFMVISLLFVLLVLFSLFAWKQSIFQVLLLLPYVLWLGIASSLNAYFIGQ